jgi:hypothetical protein
MVHDDLELTGDVDDLVAHLDRSNPGGSVSANLEESSDHRLGDARMVVRVYERYRAIGRQPGEPRRSILAVDARLAVTAIAAGGSQAVFFKVNTLGESAFLGRAVEALKVHASRQD